MGDRHQKQILGVITNKRFAMNFCIRGNTNVWCHARGYCRKVVVDEITNFITISDDLDISRSNLSKRKSITFLSS